MVQWTSEQILALAPDEKSKQAGRGLANRRHWDNLGYSDRAAWGECRGSGSKPYQTRVDLSEPAFKCSCPSRKFPCKHSLGLFLLLAAQPDEFASETPPDWVQAWLEGRDRRSQAKGNASAPSTADPEARAKRTADREARVSAGLQELDLWLRDLMRRGLASVQSQPYQFWDDIAARMVDAKAGAIARQLREMAGIANTGEGWTDRLLQRLARLHLLVSGYRNLDRLPSPLQAEIRTQIGWTQNQDELLSQAPSHRDRWQVVGQRVEAETTGATTLTVQRTWLHGDNGGHSALILSFAGGNQPLDTSLVPGMEIDADLVFYPGSYPLRALVKTRHGESEAIVEMSGYAAILDGLDAYAAALGQNPWLQEFPMLLAEVVPVRDGEGWAMVDLHEQALPIAPQFDRGWQLLAIAGGRAIAVFGEWNGRDFLPLGVCSDSRFVRL